MKNNLGIRISVVRVLVDRVLPISDLKFVSGYELLLKIVSFKFTVNMPNRKFVFRDTLNSDLSFIRETTV